MQDILNIAKNIKLVIFDVDGVLTDGSLFFGDDGQEYKAFYSRDGLGIKLLQRTGVEVGVITARESQLVVHRMNNLGIEHFYQGRLNKIEAFHEMLKKLGISAEQTAYAGDDIVDLPVMKQVGLAVRPSKGEDVRFYVDIPRADGRAINRDYLNRQRRVFEVHRRDCGNRHDGGECQAEQREPVFRMHFRFFLILMAATSGLGIVALLLVFLGGIGFARQVMSLAPIWMPGIAAALLCLFGWWYHSIRYFAYAAVIPLVTVAAYALNLPMPYRLVLTFASVGSAMTIGGTALLIRFLSSTKTTIQ